MIRIVLVDDEPTVLHGLRMRLGLTKDIRVVGEAESGDAALRLIRELTPDAVVMEVELPDCDGLAVTRILHAERIPVAVVILTMHDEPGTRERAFAAGATKFVGKHEGTTVLLEAIRDAAPRGSSRPHFGREENGEASLPVSRPDLKRASGTTRDFYDDYYAAVEASHAHAEFCTYAYGRDLCQHGFATMEQLAKLIDVTGLDAHSRVLDLGCGNGMIAEYISDTTGANVTGLDFVPSAINHARERTLAKRSRLDFVVGDLTQMDFRPASFDTLLSIDTIYFSDNYAETIRHWRAILKDGGQMAIYLSHGVDPEHPKETFDLATLVPDMTPLAAELRQSGLAYQSWDFTPHDYALAKRKKEILERTRSEFEAEGNVSLYDSRMGETLGVMSAIESGAHVRYLYHVRV